jgi:hypothetical protein
LKLGRTPKELLASVDAAELAELFAYYVVQGEKESPVTASADIEGQLKKAFGEA